jgi:hypothetical protein
MLSPHKFVLFIAAFAAIIGSLVTVSLATVSHFQVLAPEAVRPFLAPLMVLLCIAFPSAVVLLIEYSQALRGAEFALLTEESLSFSQFLDSLRWCPRPVAFSCFALALAALALGLVGGVPTWSSNEPLTLQVARGVMVFQASFFLLALPIVVSGLRVPVSFSAQVGSSKAPTDVT